MYSMTAYARKDSQTSRGTIHWEIKSTNHRYLELSFKLPDFVKDLEYVLRDKIRTTLSRGKLDCFLKIDLSEDNQTPFKMDFNLMDQLIEASATIEKRFPSAKMVSLFDVLRWPGLIKASDQDYSGMHPDLLKTFEEVLQDFIQTREREGAKLKSCIEERVKKMQVLLKKIEDRAPELKNQSRLKFYEKFNTLKIECDENRLEQELLYLIQKIDISEELDRLKTHLTEIERILREDKVMGRRLDFLMQELNREVNTIASKANDNMTIKDSVELKVLIEEMREQVQNIE